MLMSASVPEVCQPRALVVDDDQPIIDDVRDRLDAIGHASHGVNTLEDARAALAEGGWSYCLIDLNLPVKFGRPASMHSGLSLLSLLRDEHPELPVIVMTSFGHDSSDLAAEVISAGKPVDFIRKPFPEPGSRGRTLEQAARRAADLAAGRATTPAAQAPKAFAGGVLAIYPDRVTLCGVWIAAETGVTHMRCILDALAAQDDQGRPVRLTGPQLQEQLEHIEITTAAISGAVRDLRARITEVLRDEANLVVGPDDVIQTGKRGQPGYRLAPTLTIERYDQLWQATPVATQAMAAAAAAADQDDAATPIAADPIPAAGTAQVPTLRLAPSQPPGLPTDSDGDPISPELAAILVHLRTHNQTTASDLCAALKLTDRTASRRLAQLRDRGLARFVGTSRRGHWEVVG